MYTAQLSLFTLVLLLLNLLLLSVQGAPVQSLWNSRYRNNTIKDKKNVIAYRRYVRRRPSQYPNDLYVDEYVEVFHTRRRPPTYWLNDDEIDRIIRCDFNPNLEECKQQPQAPPTVVPSLRPPIVRTTTVRPKLPEVTTPEVIITTSLRPKITTERDIEETTTTTTDASIITTTEDLPFLPNIPQEEVEVMTENDQVYVVTKPNGNGNENENEEFDGEDQSNGEYYEEETEEEQIENGL